jgi:PAS domain S-box-containing protein
MGRPLGDHVDSTTGQSGAEGPYGGADSAAGTIPASATELATALLQASPDCVKIIAPDGRLTFMNQNGRCLMELDDTAQVVGSPWAALWPEAERAKVQQSFKEAQTTGSSRFQGFCPTAKGSARWWDVITTPIRGPQGDIQALLSVSRDITALKEAERSAAAALRSQEDFVANLSHELRTPLTAILGFSELLVATPGLDAEPRRHLSNIQSAGRTLLALLNDLLDLSRAAAGALTVRDEPCDLAELLASVTELARPMAAGKPIEIRCAVDHNLEGWFLLDDKRVRQIIVNLVSNAVKFTDAGEIEVCAMRSRSARGDFAYITVRDTGEGIANDLIPRLFGRFVQADTGMQRRHAGAGLGLAISRELVELMGGRIGAESALGDGSTFWIELPLKEVVAPKAVATLDAAPAASAASILLADDNPMNRQILTLLLSACGHQVRGVVDGRQAVDAAMAEAFDLILMDIQMPVMDGIAAMRQLRATSGPNRRAPILAITANVLREQVESYYAAGADGHIAKPFTAAEVLETVNGALAAPRSAKAAAAG